MLKKPMQIPSMLPAGCKQHIPKYDKAEGLSKHSSPEKVSEATKQWYDLAESEFIDIMGLSKEEATAYVGRADGPSFVHKFPKGSERSARDGANDC